MIVKYAANVTRFRHAWLESWLKSRAPIEQVHVPSIACRLAGITTATRCGLSLSNIIHNSKLSIAVNQSQIGILQTRCFKWLFSLLAHNKGKPPKLLWQARLVNLCYNTLEEGYSKTISKRSASTLRSGVVSFFCFRQFYTLATRIRRATALLLPRLRPAVTLGLFFVGGRCFYHICI